MVIWTMNSSDHYRLRHCCPSGAFVNLGFVFSALLISCALAQTKQTCTTMDDVLLLDYNGWKLYKHGLNETTTNLDFPSLNTSDSNSNSFIMKGCINGLVFVLLEWPNQTLILWNPSIRKYIILPEPIHGVPPTTNVISAYSFGHDPSTNDYKILRNVRPYTQTLHGQQLGDPLGEIFRLSKGTWESLKVPTSLPLIDEYKPAYLNGFIHWLVASSCGCRNFIIAFDMDVEAFREIEVPENLRGDPKVTLTLEVWKGVLSIFEVRDHQTDITMWVMEEYGVPESWTKKLVIKSLQVSTLVSMVRRSSKVLLTEMMNLKFLSYDPEMSQLEESEIKAGSQSVQMMPYMDSSVLLHHQDAKTY